MTGAGVVHNPMTPAPLRAEAAAEPAGGRWRDGVAAWLALTAPGILVTRALVVLSLLASPWLTGAVYVAPTVSRLAAALLIAQVAATLLVSTRHPSGLTAAVWFAGFVVEALLSGVLLGGELHGAGAGAIAAVVVLAIGVAAAGWPALVIGALCVVGASTAGARLGVAAPVLWVPGLPFSTHLSVETGLAGAAATPPWSFPTRLSVETLYAGSPAITGTPGFALTLDVETWYAGAPAVDANSGLLLPALAIALIAICAGMAVNLLRVRKTSDAVTAAMVTAGKWVW